jgi:hypothetical protein
MYLLVLLFKKLANTSHKFSNTNGCIHIHTTGSRYNVSNQKANV